MTTTETIRAIMSDGKPRTVQQIRYDGRKRGVELSANQVAHRRNTMTASGEWEVAAGYSAPTTDDSLSRAYRLAAR